METGQSFCIITIAHFAKFFAFLAVKYVNCKVRNPKPVACLFYCFYSFFPRSNFTQFSHIFLINTTKIPIYRKN